MPLSDIRVVEVCEALAGPFAAMLLADQGADVIKIEEPTDDPTRGATANLGFVSFNRNKRSIGLDITNPKGREVLEALLRWADVLMINMRPGRRQRRGLTYKDVAAINPRLIYASLTAYGEGGPDGDMAGMDVLIQARSGDMAYRRPPGGPATHVTLWHFDMTAPILNAYAVALALRERERTGRGQKVETNLLQAALTVHTGQMTRAVGKGEGPPSRAYNLFGTFLCSDGRFISLVYSRERGWHDLCRGLGRDDLAEVPEFATIAKRTEKAQAIYEILSDIFFTKPAAEWEAILRASDTPVSMVKEMWEVYEDPQVIANQMITQFEQPGIGLVEANYVPFKMSENADEPHIRRPAPGRGEHTLEVLQELGYSPDEVEALKAEGVAG